MNTAVSYEDLNPASFLERSGLVYPGKDGTGFPKGVEYQARDLNALGEAQETGLNARSIYLRTVPLLHCNGWWHVWAATAVGATQICLRKVDRAG